MYTFGAYLSGEMDEELRRRFESKAGSLNCSAEAAALND